MDLSSMSPPSVPGHAGGGFGVTGVDPGPGVVAGGGPGLPASAVGPGVPPQSRSRPCDTCRLRKTRCVRHEGQLRCVLCTFHNQPCTFLRGPTPRRRQNRDRDGQRPGQDDDQATGGGNRRASHDSGDGISPPNQPGAGTSHGQQIMYDQQGGAGGVASPDDDSSRSSSHTQHMIVPPAQSYFEAPRPRILSNTLGLDLRTHAQYVGRADCRDPILLDLHRPNQSVPHDPTSLSFARRLDDRTTFLVHPDETAAPESRRIADLDAIEATVQPLGRTLVDLYFRIVHPSFPILHKDVFISKHRVSYRHFAPSLLAAVYLLALDWQLYDSSLAGREIETIPDPAALEELAEKTIAQDMRRPKLSTLEAGLLLLQRNRRIVETGAHTDQASNRLFTAQLVAMAQDLGIHVDCSSWSIPAWEIGLRRRLAWALYLQDRWGACEHGRPFLIRDFDWDVEPCSASDYPELEGAGHESAIATGWELFLRHIELAQLLSEVMDTFYSATAIRAGGTLEQMGIVAVVELAKPFVFRLREWHSSLPTHLRLENTTFRELCANGALHLAHASVEMALHRALIRAMTPDTPQPLHDALRATARSKVQSTIDLLARLRPEHMAAFWGSESAYQAAGVGSLAGLLWATADSADEMAWCAARVEDLRWALRVRGAAAPFAREALRLLERDIGGLGIVKARTFGAS